MKPSIATAAILALALGASGALADQTGAPGEAGLEVDGEVTGHVQRIDEPGGMLYLDTGEMFELHHDATVAALQEGEMVRVTFEEGPGGVLIATEVEVVSDYEVDVDIDIEEGAAD
jgi:hypothetical protein